MKKLMEMLKVPDDMPIESGMVSKRIEEAQTKIEGSHFDVRKHLLDYDSVMNKQREVIYKKRDDILAKSNEEIFAYLADLAQRGNSVDSFNQRVEQNGKDAMVAAGRFIALKTVDFFWQEHLELMDNVRDATRLRAYGQQDPLVEYKNEANKQFRILLDTVEGNILQNLLNVSITPQAAQKIAQPQPRPQSQPAANYDKVDRNAPCPCGSGKKYKKCHGK